ncbi:MAG TPA: hypothetical protein VF622_15145 [Segetibacter sp.]|jgi:hypothetical protein
MCNKFFFLLSLLVSSIFVSAQPVDVVNLIVNNKESKTAYIGVDNFYRIRNFDKYKSIVPHPQAKLLNDKLLIRAQSVGTFSVTFVTKKGAKEQVSFNVKRVPYPLIAIGEHTRTSIDKSYLLNNKRVSIITSEINDPFFEGYKVQAFIAELNGQTFTLQGNEFSDDLLAAIQKAEPGNKLTISSVKAFNADLDRHFNIDSKISFGIR